MKSVTIHSDGACHGNPGPGGWSAILEYGRHKRALSGGTPATTNNRMELQAAIEGLRALKEPCRVEFYTDSQYLRQGVKSWLVAWRRNGWKTSAKKAVKNADLWRALDAAALPHKITWNWLKGHAGHELNEECDELATAEIKKIKASMTPEQMNAVLREFLSNRELK